jgi:hypothetical protein
MIKEICNLKFEIQDFEIRSFIIHPSALIIFSYIGPGSSRGPRLPPLSSNAPSGEGAEELPPLSWPDVPGTFSVSSISLKVSSLVAAESGSLLSVPVAPPTVSVDFGSLASCTADSPFRPRVEL